jgi:uncharacterized protein (UPF0254 family)
MRFQKMGKKIHWISTGHETQFKSIFGVKLSLPILSFLECFRPIIGALMCIIAINVFEPSAFNLEFQYFMPLFNEIS